MAGNIKLKALPSNQRETQPKAPPNTTARNEVTMLVLVQVVPGRMANAYVAV